MTKRTMIQKIRTTMEMKQEIRSIHFSFRQEVSFPPNSKDKLARAKVKKRGIVFYKNEPDGGHR